MQTRRSWLAAAVALVLSGCAGPRAVLSPVVDAGRCEALLISGGARREKNYRSHLEHIRGIYHLLREAGVPAGRITVFCADGSDPAPDVAARDPERYPDHWLLAGTRLGRVLPDLQFENSTVPGAHLLPARKGALQTWFQLRGRALRAGDTLLVYVTDHGVRTGKPREAAVSLWGETLPRSELLAWLDRIDPGVRIVLWMSQCYAGAFAEAIYKKEEPGEVRGNLCGFFSTLADRPAWGCFPESLDSRDRLGHSLRMIEALRAGFDLDRAHLRVLTGDRTPNVPQRTSDAYLQRLLHRAANERGVPIGKLADRLLGRAWKQPGRWQWQRTVLDALSRRVGVAPVRSLRHLQSLEIEVRRVRNRCRTFRASWQQALQASTRHTLDRFQEQRPGWTGRTLAALCRAQQIPLDPQDQRAARARLTRRLLDTLVPFVRSEAGLFERLQTLRDNRQRAGALQLRLDEREGALLRMRVVLESMAGRMLAEEDATARRALQKLRTCERQTPWGGGACTGRPIVTVPADDTALPAIEQETAALESVRPTWLGVRYAQESEEIREQYGLEPGAVVIHDVLSDSPAAEAGLLPGDTIIGTPGSPFETKDALREAVMLAPAGSPFALEILRGGDRRTVSAVLAPYPDRLPEPVARTKKGAPAPPRDGLVALRGALPGPGEPVLLFFFSTWCGPCKRAVPALLRWEREQGAPVLAITGESKEAVEAFLERFEGDFPGRIARDPRGLVSAAHGARSYPTFVLIDSSGTVRAVKRGYSTLQGLELRPAE